tara:strand:+ start:244 stop:501 length:258 start_codon:yes stop_codon:yes gene_type:complete
MNGNKKTSVKNETRQLPPLKNDGRVEMRFNIPGRNKAVAKAMAIATGAGTAILESGAIDKIQEKFSQTKLGQWAKKRDDKIKNRR